MRPFIKPGIWLFFLLIIFNCAANRPDMLGKQDQQVEPSGINSSVSEPEPAKIQPETPAIVPLNPRVIEAEFCVEISNIQVFRGERLKNYNRSKGIPAGAPPQLYVWSSGIAQRDNQIVLDLALEGPPPADIFIDNENQNQIYFWNLNSYLGKQNSIIIKRRVKVQSFELLTLLDSTNFLAYDLSDKNYRFYTKPEPFIELNTTVTEQALRIAGEEPNPFQKAKLIFDWVNRNMTYFYPPPERGAAAALESLKGDKGQFSYLFIALCRAVGVPARFVAGFIVDEASNLRYHTWAEFFIPEHGWFPADPTLGANFFGRLDNRRIVASVGNNIKLLHVPHWATYRNSEVEKSRTPFMQLATIVHTGISADIKTRIHTIRIEAKEADSITQFER